MFAILMVKIIRIRQRLFVSKIIIIWSCQTDQRSNSRLLTIEVPIRMTTMKCRECRESFTFRQASRMPKLELGLVAQIIVTIIVVISAQYLKEARY